LESLLVFAGCGIHEFPSVALPSWVPDWQQVPDFNTFNPEYYSTGGGKEMLNQLSYFILPYCTENFLGAFGFVASNVHPVSTVLGLSLEGAKRHFECCTEYLSTRSTAIYPAGIHFPQALFRVALRDRDLIRERTLLSPEDLAFHALAMAF
jgi:hypothetical protein